MSDADEYEPTETQLEWMERLTQITREAMGYSDDLVAAVATLQGASLVAVDVVRGQATDSDLRDACEGCLRALDGWVNVHPIRRVLRKVIDGVERELVATGRAPDPVAALPEGDNAFADGADPPRKERAG